MLKSVEDLIQIDVHINEVNSKRDALAEKIKQLKDAEDVFVDEMDHIEKRLNDATLEISQIEKIEDIEPLRAKYGKLKILDQIETAFKEQQRALHEKEVLEGINSLNVEDFENGSFDSLINLKKIITTYDIGSGLVLNKYNAFIESLSTKLMSNFKQELLNSKWDTEYFVKSKKIVLDLRRQSSALFNLQKHLLTDPSIQSKSESQVEQDKCAQQYWNLQCISHNFFIKFMYHFSNPKFDDSGQQKQSIELYFKFLDRYLEANLFRCIDIFHDEEAGLTKEFLHEQFINHTLNPIRNKVTQTLTNISENQNQENLRTMIILISQIFINDNALSKKHFYSGVGLVSLLPNNILEAWLEFELDSTLRQYEKIISSPLSTNGTDLVKLLENMYGYFEPCFNIEYGNLESYKLQIVSRIFLELISSYNKFIVSADPTLAQLPEEKQLEVTFLKLHNIILLEEYVSKLRFKPAFIELTFTFNKLSGSSYTSIFSESLGSLEETIVTIRESIVHRWKKILKYSLNPYFRLSTWHDFSTNPNQCSTELINAIQKCTQLKNSFNELEFPNSISISIMTSLLSQWVSYLKDYVVKVNSFSDQGLKQVTIDYKELSNVFKIESIPPSVEQMEFEEFLTVLGIKDEKKDIKLPFLTKSYMSHSDDYSEVRSALDLKYISKSELRYALYKIL